MVEQFKVYNGTAGEIASEMLDDCDGNPREVLASFVAASEGREAPSEADYKLVNERIYAAAALAARLVKSVNRNPDMSIGEFAERLLKCVEFVYLLSYTKGFEDNGSFTLRKLGGQPIPKVA